MSRDPQFGVDHQSRGAIRAAMIVLLCALAFSAQGQIGVPLSYPATLNDYAAGDSAQDRDVDIAVDGQGRWVVVWESNTTLGSTGNDYDIFTAWSDDHGQTWSVPLPLNTFADRDGLATDRDPRLTVDADGAFIVTWMSHCRPDGTIDNDFDILMSVSVNRGQTWAPATSVNINAVADEGNDFDPVIGVGGEVWVAAWRTLDSLVSTIGPDAEIVFSRREAGQSEWSSPLPLNSDAANDVSQDAFPQLVYHDGAWMCVWHASLYFGSDYDIVISRSVDQAKSWSPVTPLYANAVSDGNAHDDNPQVCVNGRGDMIVIWSSTNSLGGTIGSDRDLLVSRSSDGGASWSAPAALHSTFASDNGDDNFPRIACDSDGTFIVVWQSESSLGGSGSDSDIFISKSSDGGVTWSTPIAANLNATADSGDDLMPRAAAYGGAWLIAWQSHDTMGGTLGPDADLLRARFALPDCNSNTVADQTEPDVNGNNIPDDCEGSTCTGDIAPPLGGNGSVNVDDLLAVINAWGACSGACLSDIAPPSGDGQVNVDDLLAIINNWGPCD